MRPHHWRAQRLSAPSTMVSADPEIQRVGHVIWQHYMISDEVILLCVSTSVKILWSNDTPMWMHDDVWELHATKKVAWCLGRVSLPGNWWSISHSRLSRHSSSTQVPLNLVCFVSIANVCKSERFSEIEDTLFPTICHIVRRFLLILTITRFHLLRFQEIT